MSAGYSGTPLTAKLGIQPGDRVGVLGDRSFLDGLLAPLPPGAVLVSNPRTPCPVLVVFAPRESLLRTRLARAMKIMPADGALWVAWPKKSSPQYVDLTENILRTLILPLGLVDNKVCALDQDWSGLRFVVRKANRASW